MVAFITIDRRPLRPTGKKGTEMLKTLEPISGFVYVIASFVLAGSVAYKYIWLEWRDDVNKRTSLITSELPASKDPKAS